MLNQIVERINSVGWNLYELGKNDIDTMASKGPAKTLEIGKQYVLFPIVNDPTNVEQIKGAISYMRRELIFPKIKVRERLLGIVTLVIEENRVKITRISDVYLSYQDFYEALATLQPTTRDALS